MSLLRRHDLVHVPFDVDAKLFIDTYGVTDPFERWAVNYRAVKYKEAGIWNAMIGIWPVVKDVTTCKYSQKVWIHDSSFIYSNPATPTYSKSTGITLGSGITATIQNLVGSNGGSDVSKEWGGGIRTNQTYGFWSTYAETNNTDTDGNGSGGAGSAGNVGLRLHIRKGNTSYNDQYGSNSRDSYGSESDGLGLFSGGYNSVNVNAVWKNGSDIGSGGVNSGVACTSNISWGPSTKKYGMFYVSTLLTATNHADQYIIESFIQSRLRV